MSPCLRSTHVRSVRPSSSLGDARRRAWLRPVRYCLGFSMRTGAIGDNNTSSLAECGFELAQPCEDAHTRHRFGRYQPSTANGRISAAVADHEGEVDDGTWLYRFRAVIERRGRHISVAPPTVGWRAGALWCASSWSTEGKGRHARWLRLKPGVRSSWE